MKRIQPITELRFADVVDCCDACAQHAAYPFVPSRAQREALYMSIVNALQDTPTREACDWIRATYRGAGTSDMIVAEMFKRDRGMM